MANIQKPFKVIDLPHFSKRKSATIINDVMDNLVTYTDGSKSNNGVGSGFCFLNCQTIIKYSKYKLSNYCSVFQSELFAIFKALEYINRKFSGNNITICTDSLSAIKAIGNSSSLTYLVQQVYSEIHKASHKNTNISFAWIRGHEGNCGNELADKMAKEGAVSHQSIAYDLMPVSYVKKLVYQKNLRIWNQRWIETSTGATTKKYWPTVYDRLYSKRHFLTNYYLTQIITNHGRFNEYLTRFDIKFDAYCSKCVGKIENAEHIIFECSKYEEQRSLLKAKAQEKQIHWPCSEKVLISQKLFNDFSEFVKKVLSKD